MLSAHQLVSVTNTATNPKFARYRSIVEAAITKWVDRLNPRQHTFGVYPFTKTGEVFDYMDKDYPQDADFRPAREGCLIGAAILGEICSSSGGCQLQSASALFGLDRREVEDLSNGFDSYQAPADASDAFLCGLAVSQALRT